MYSVIVGALGFAIALPLLLAAMWIGPRVGLVDRPGPIKPHSRPIPYTGGVATVASIVGVGLVIGAPIPVLAGLALMCAVGFVDDARGLEAPIKLALELPPLAISLLGVGLSPLESLLYLIVGVVLVNAFNVVDGLDGLAGGVALLPMLVLSAAPGWAGGLGAAAVGALAAFLLLNLRPARVFMGDEGSLVLGQLLWLLPIAGLRSGGLNAIAVWAFLWAFPIINAAFVVSVRLLEGRSVLRGDRSHLYDVLNRRVGLARTLLICWSIAAAGAVAALVVG